MPGVIYIRVFPVPPLGTRRSRTGKTTAEARAYTRVPGHFGPLARRAADTYQGRPLNRMIVGQPRAGYYNATYTIHVRHSATRNNDDYDDDITRR